MKHRSQVVILLYHRVVDAASDPQLLCVGVSHFAEHLAHLKQYSVIRLQTLVTAIRNHNLPERAVAVTFDDGYADNLANAKPLLERYEVPATIHIATRSLGKSAEFWWDDLENLLLLSPSLPRMLHVSVGSKEHTWEFGESAEATDTTLRWDVQSRNNPTPRHQAYRDLHRLLRPLPAAQQDAALAQVRSQLTQPPAPRPTHRLLKPDEVRSLATGGLVDVGAHSVTHTVLASLSLEDQRGEILDSKRQLESILGRPVASFAYPYGGREMVSRGTIGLVKECGYASACSTLAEPVHPKSDPFFLPRFLVRDWNDEEFARHLREFFR